MCQERLAPPTWFDPWSETLPARSLVAIWRTQLPRLLRLRRISASATSSPRPGAPFMYGLLLSCHPTTPIAPRKVVETTKYNSRKQRLLSRRAARRRRIVNPGDRERERTLHHHRNNGSLSYRSNLFASLSPSLFGLVNRTPYLLFQWRESYRTRGCHSACRGVARRGCRRYYRRTKWTAVPHETRGGANQQREELDFQWGRGGKGGEHAKALAGWKLLSC